MKTLCIVLAMLFAWTASAATTSNDDSCDIGVAPAATLLLPYFEVDLDHSNGETTVFTITNVTNAGRIARVTLWTDYAVPILTFNIPLTGYDVQSISLYDVLARGVTGPPVSIARGRYSRANPASTCAELPRTLPPDQVPTIQQAFLEGVEPGCRNIGDVHDNAVGYATIDLVTNCTTNNPLDEKYWTEDIAFDNVLIGDYQQVHSANDFAQGAPLVHIRAIPEGGTPAERIAHQQEHGSNFPRTFYRHYQPAHAPKLDSRQPLPSTFAARWIASDSGFDTHIKIWREGQTGLRATCATHDDNVMEIGEAVVFDEAENAVGDLPISRTTPITRELMLPATSMTHAWDTRVFPRLVNGAVSGWMYLNLGNRFADDDIGNWVIASMRAAGRYSVDVEAAVLGNGCSARTHPSEVTTGTDVVGPRP